MTKAIVAGLLGGALLLPATGGAAGLREVGARRLDARLLELTLRTDAVTGPTRVRVLLPAHYGSASERRNRYPVLYLLHGAQDDETSWTVKGDAERLTAGRRLIVVMPDSGTTGGYTNWYNNGRGGPPAWETYHVDQLIPFVDRHFRTVAARGGRAIAGLSMGGFGAMSYAARHPDRFVAAASFSGAVDTDNPLDIAVTGDLPFGPRATQEIRWRGHNPTDLAGNLRGLRLTIRTGNGQPGGPFGGGDLIEQAVYAMSESFHLRLAKLGIAHVWDDYGPGGHLWPYWQRDLRETLPGIMKAFSSAPATPATVRAFRAVEPRYEIYGWHVTLRRRALEFSELRDAGRSGFTLRGSGSGTVVTPPGLLRTRAVYRIAARGRGGTVTERRRTDARGRLRVEVALGPANAHQEDTAAARRAGGTKTYTSTVTFRADA